MAASRRSFLFVMNPRASHHEPEAIRRAIRGFFDGKNIGYRLLEPDGAEETLAEIDAAFSDKHFDTVVAVGGDGTIMSVISGVLKHKARLGIIPKGTGNLLAGSLHIPVDEAGALETLLSGRIEMVYPARVNGRLFAIACGVGIDAEIIARTAPARKKRMGMLAYFIEGARRLVDFGDHLFELALDGEKKLVRGKGVMIINRPNFLEAIRPLAPLGKIAQARFRERMARPARRLDVCVFNIRNSAEYIPALIQLFSGQYGDEEPPIQHFEAEHVVIDARPRNVRVQADGEILDGLPVEIDVLDEAVPIIVPEE